MATRKLIQKNANGTQQEYIGVNTSVGAGTAGEYITADASGKLDSTFLPTGTGADTVSLIAGEGLSAGDYVYIDATGKVMKADANSPAKAARGYVLTAVLNAASATVFFDDSNTAIAGKTPGATQYLSETPGATTEIAPTTSGHIVQEVGFATSATSIHTSIKEPVIRA